MGTLKSTLKIESTDLFPTPVNFTVVNNNSVAGTFSGFNNVVVPVTTGIQLNVASIDGTGGAYIYAQAPSTNVENVHICHGTTAGNTIAILAPGEVLFMPYMYAGATCSVYAVKPGTGAASLNYFIGEKV